MPVQSYLFANDISQSVVVVSQITNFYL